ncbi:Tetratricopeptide repeat-containing protein [Nonlabens sp. Hel1_33_55]|uniref:tetratricopeptide repeat protein n=1 Tax=Nonlabens sp. Hel1_33_55 TaxID=1336802 RepID=UPI000875BE81|nr:tetratricopeptide repeat protein [Nonlabens sp. Hel1_33_55]SCX95852.1 Tetratricopeptide repeat-containing protein [Nonlabens sp. Hel1_33_55]
MNYRLLILGLAFSSLAFAQKREIRKIEKAVEDNDYKEASSLFSEINESEVEEKYVADYTYFKAVTMLGNPNRVTASGKELQNIMVLFDKAKDLGYDSAAVSGQKSLVSDAIFAHAQKMLQAGKQDEALASVNYLLELDPSNQRMRENAANLAYRSGDFKSAKDNYQQLLDEGYTGIEETALATSLGSNKDEVFPNLKTAEVAVKTGQYTNARLEKSDSKLGTIVTNLAWVYNNNGEKPKAKSLVMEIFDKYPEDESLKIAAANLYLLVGMEEEYKKAVSKMNEEITDPAVYQNLAVAAADKENWDQAIDYYNKSIELDNSNYATQNNLAAAYIQKGNLEETTAVQQKEYYMNAAKHYEKVLELKPDMDSAKTTLISIYKAFNMDDKAAALEAGN